MQNAKCKMHETQNAQNARRSFKMQSQNASEEKAVCQWKSANVMGQMALNQSIFVKMKIAGILIFLSRKYCVRVSLGACSLTHPAWILNPQSTAWVSLGLKALALLKRLSAAHGTTNYHSENQ